MSRECRKYSQISVAFDFEHFGSGDACSVDLVVQHEEGKAIELALKDPLGSHHCPGSPLCCFSCRQTVNGGDWRVSTKAICSKAIWFRRKSIRRGQPSIDTEFGTCFVAAFERPEHYDMY